MLSKKNILYKIYFFNDKGKDYIKIISLSIEEKTFFYYFFRTYFVAIPTVALCEHQLTELLLRS